MRKARGFGVVTDPTARQFTTEFETFACCHCQKMIERPAYKSPTDDVNGKPLGAWCTCCDAAMCPDCIGKPCLPIEKRLEAWERKYDFWRHFNEAAK